MSKEPLIVYWAPGAPEWNMLYPEPINLMSDLMSQKSPNRGNSHFFSCPASSNFFERTFVFSNSLESKYDYDFTNTEIGPVITPTSKTYLNFDVVRPPTLINKPMFQITLTYLLFSETSVNATFTPPYLHKPGYTKYATCFPGTFDISKWFRPYSFELQLWEPKGTLILEEDEPLFYAHLETDRKVELRRFSMNEKLNGYMNHCIDSTKWQGSKLPLERRYKVFSKAKMGDLIATEIKNNLV